VKLVLHGTNFSEIIAPHPEKFVTRWDSHPMNAQRLNQYMSEVGKVLRYM